MSLSVVSSPVDNPTGVRLTTGTITFDSAYVDAGEPITAAQFGAGVNGIPNRLPDFVTFTSLSGAAAGTMGLVGYDRANAKIKAYGDSAIASDGIEELDTSDDLSTLVMGFLAFWIGANPAGASTA